MIRVGDLYPVWNDPARRCAVCGGRTEGVGRTEDGADLCISCGGVRTEAADGVAAP